MTRRDGVVTGIVEAAEAEDSDGSARVERRRLLLGGRLALGVYPNDIAGRLGRILFDRFGRSRREGRVQRRIGAGNGPLGITGSQRQVQLARAEAVQLDRLRKHWMIAALP